jgi:hypothetical protein
MTTDQSARCPPAPLVVGLLHLDSLAVLYGPSGVGNIDVALDLAERVIVGGSWHGCTVTHQGLVLYVIAEGASGVGIRTEAWELHHGVTADVWLPEPVNVYSPPWASALAGVVVPIGLGVFTARTDGDRHRRVSPQRPPTT